MEERKALSPSRNRNKKVSREVEIVVGVEDGNLEVRDRIEFELQLLPL